MALEPRISLSAAGSSPVGHERIRLLEAVGREGSISAAAQAVGLSYKAAWDALYAMNNLFGRPLIEGQTGGRRGGGATLTPAGLAVIAAFHRLEGELSRAFQQLEPDLTGSGLTTGQLMWGFMMRTSARNVLRGTVARITDGAVNAEVVLALSETSEITAIVTRESVQELGLVPGLPAMALIKASFVILADVGDAKRTTARNRLEGIVLRHEVGAVNSEITLDIGDGKTLTAIVSRQGAEMLDLTLGAAACALIDAGHIILAVD